jgi:double-stranded uracil-DNA glycosylase
MKPWKPSKEEILAAKDKTVSDIVARNLRVLFVGVNPGLYTAAIGRHFGRPGNRFWPALHQGGFTDRLLSPFESRELLKYGYGITNLVDRATVRADELTPDELVAGAQRLEGKVRKYRPRFVAVLGVQAYRFAFDRAKAVVGRQTETMSGAVVWVLPNPSGLNAHYRPADLAHVFGVLKMALDEHA